MEKKHRFGKFSEFKAKHWIVFSFCLLAAIFGLYMSISMTVKIFEKMTLFGDSSIQITSSTVEKVGPTSADISVLVLFWILTLILIALVIFYGFFKKVDNSKPVRKEIVNGRTVIITEEKEKKDDSRETKK